MYGVENNYPLFTIHLLRNSLKYPPIPPTEYPHDNTGYLHN